MDEFGAARQFRRDLRKLCAFELDAAHAAEHLCCACSQRGNILIDFRLLVRLHCRLAGGGRHLSDCTAAGSSALYEQLAKDLNWIAWARVHLNQLGDGEFHMPSDLVFRHPSRSSGAPCHGISEVYADRGVGRVEPLGPRSLHAKHRANPNRSAALHPRPHSEGADACPSTADGGQSRVTPFRRYSLPRVLWRPCRSSCCRSWCRELLRSRRVSFSLAQRHREVEVRGSPLGAVSTGQMVCSQSTGGSHM